MQAEDDVFDYPLRKLRIVGVTPEASMSIVRTLPTALGGQVYFGMTDNPILFSDYLKMCEERGINPSTIGMRYNTANRMFQPSTIGSRYSSTGISEKEHQKLRDLLIKSGKHDTVIFNLERVDEEQLEHFHNAATLLDQEGYRVKLTKIGLYEREPQSSDSLLEYYGGGQDPSLIIGPHMNARNLPGAQNLEKWFLKTAEDHDLQVDTIETWPEAVDCGAEGGIRVMWRSTRKNPAEEVREALHQLIKKT